MGDTTGLAEPFKTQVEQLLAAAGGRIWVKSGFRTYAQQVQARRDNGCPDLYTSPSSSCRIPTARPGTSQHEKGLAVDLGGDLSLADRLAARFGLKRTVPGEAWHFEPTNKGGPVARVAAVGDDDGSDGGLIDGIVSTLRRLTITGLILAGGAALVVMGGYRAVTGRSLTADAAGAAVTGAQLAATGGTSAAATTATKASKATTAKARRTP